MKTISAVELQEKLENGEGLHIIDVREDEEVAEGKIPQAKHIALGEVPDTLDAFDKNEHYYIVCRSGGRSGKACEFLIENGYNVTNMTGGMLAWEGDVE